MSGPVFIKGNRIELRTTEEADIEFLVRGVNHPEIRRHISVFRTPTNTEQYHDTFEAIDSDDSGASLLVCVDGDAVGSAQLYPVNDAQGRANLGCWLLPEAQGNGYATEACELLVDYGFRELRLHRISGVVMAPNEDSRRLLERIGFTHEGTTREATFANGEYVDEVRYGLLEGEWRDRAD